MPEEIPAVGLMEAIAPIARRRPVHLIISGGPDDSLTVVLVPKQTDAKEDAAIARGFSITQPPAVLDRELAAAMTRTFVPSHVSLQRVLDQVAESTEAARVATLKKSAGAGKSGGAKTAAAPAASQITFEPEGTSAATPSPAATPAPAAAAAPSEAPAAASEDAAEASSVASAAASPTAVDAAADATSVREPELAAAGAAAVGADAVSSLFD